MARVQDDSPAPGGVPKPEAAPDLTRPASTLPEFSVEKFWDADSTPPALAALSRVVGGWLPSSGARTPTIEAGVAMASLMHDVAYYYGGSTDDKARADELFGEQITYFVGKVDLTQVKAAKRTAAVDQAAVAIGGGWPFRESYSWSYGFAQSQRGYATLGAGEHAMIQGVARRTFEDVVNQIAEGTFEPSEVLKAKLAAASPEYQAQIKTHIFMLARALQVELKGQNRGAVPGF